MKKYVYIIVLLVMFVVYGKTPIVVHGENFCDSGQKYYFDCENVATQCTYKKSNGEVAYININDQGEALAAEGDGSKQNIKNWKDDSDNIPAVDIKYISKKQCPPYLIERWGLYAINSDEDLQIAKNQFPDLQDIYSFSDSSSNTIYKSKRKKTNSSAPDVENCTGFKSEKDCNAGKTAEYGNFGCAWNKKYNFCSPTGLVYLSCGDPSEADENAYDLPVIVPRLVSYFIIILKTVTPIVLIIMGMIQIIKAIASSNDDEMNKAKSSLIKKLISAVLIFFSISIVQFVIDQVADDSEDGSVSSCMSCFINNDCNGAMYYTDGYGKCYYLSGGVYENCKTDIGSKKKN